jgi:hypothetical protein
LQDVIQGLATRRGTGDNHSGLEPETAGSFAKISIQMEIGGQIDQLASLIRGIENSPKLLMVDEINVRSLFRPVGFPQPQGVPQLAAQNLRVSLTVSGLARSQASASTKSEAAPSQSRNSVLKLQVLLLIRSRIVTRNLGKSKIEVFFDLDW